jgi:hypothetical protein
LPESLESFHYFAETFKELDRSHWEQARPLSPIELLNSHGHHPFKQVSVIEPVGTENWLAEIQCISANALTKPLSPAQWHKLERISFRSGILRHDNDLGLINRLLLLTAPVAENLPNLRSLEVFNTSTHSAVSDWEVPSCLFRYSIQHADAILFWESHWQLPLGTKTAEFEFYPKVKCAWEKAALVHTGHGITILINEPKGETDEDITTRQFFWTKAEPRLAEDFRLDAIHPFTRFLMRVSCHQTG